MNLCCMKYLSVIKYCICTCVDGKIGANVKYRVDPLPDGLYVCLDPREGLVFAGGLTYKINNGSESVYMDMVCMHVQTYVT